MLAILSFEKENHKALKEINFVDKLEQQGMFECIFRGFEEKEEGRKGREKKDRVKELTLAVAIIMANLSSEEDFVRGLLGVAKWKGRGKEAGDEAAGGKRVKGGNEMITLGNLNHMGERVKEQQMKL